MFWNLLVVLCYLIYGKGNPCFIVYMCNFIHVGNTSVIVTGSCLVYTVNKELGNTDPATASMLDTNIYNELL